MWMMQELMLQYHQRCICNEEAAHQLQNTLEHGCTVGLGGCFRSQSAVLTWIMLTWIMQTNQM
jgi:hypothetical protein